MKPERIIHAPVQISKNCVVVLHVFYRDDSLGDLWMFDHEKHGEERHELYERGAEQLIEMLEGHETPHFLACLADACNKRVKQHDDKYDDKYGRPQS